MKSPLILLLMSLFAGSLIISCSKNDENVKNTHILTGDMTARLDSAADAVFMKANTPGLIALVSVEGEEDFLIKRGVSNIVTNEPMDEMASFRIAGNTIPFTGTAVLLLAQEGKINLDTNISTYFPEYKIPDGNKITVRMLGSMTSGLYDYMNDSAFVYNHCMKSPDEPISIRSMLSISFSHPLNFQPGSDYKHSNTDLILLGALIEKVTGKPASEVIKEKVIKPLNLEQTYWGSTFFTTTPYCHGYNSDFIRLADVTYLNPSWSYTAGQMISSIPDLKRWAKELGSGSQLNEGMKKEMFSFGKKGYGFCLRRMHFRQTYWYGQSGNTFGYNSQVWYCPEKKISLIIYSNTDTKAPTEELLSDFIVLLGA